MASVLARPLLFLSSYFPLSLIFFILLFQSNLWVASCILAVGVVGLGGMLLYFSVVQRLGPIQVKVAALQQRDGEAMSYIVSYVIPFVALPFK